MQRAACARLRRTSDWYKKYRDSAKNSTYFKLRRRATAMARSMLNPLSERGKRRKRVVTIGALVQMFTFGVILFGAAVVLVGSILNPRQADPMGMFGLPSVRTITCGSVNVNNRAMRPIEIVSRHANREAA